MNLVLLETISFWTQQSVEKILSANYLFITQPQKLAHPHTLAQPENPRNYYHHEFNLIYSAILQQFTETELEHWKFNPCI